MNIQGLLIGFFSLASGLVMFVLPRRSRLAAKADNSVRKAELRAGATERFFEERRTLDAYPLAPTNSKWRLREALFTLLGFALIVLSSFRRASSAIGREPNGRMTPLGNIRHLELATV